MLLQDTNTLSILVRDPARMSNTWSTGWIKFRSWVTRIKVLPRFAARAREKRSDLSGVLIVEVVDRLVGEDERGIVDESPRNRDALLLAAAQFRRPVPGAIAKTDRVEEFQAVRWIRPPLREHRHKNILERCELREQVVGLKMNPTRSLR